MTCTSIVLVHGFQGHQRTTWTRRGIISSGTEEHLSERGNETQRLRRFSSLRRRESTTDVFWPADLLPTDCPSARILTWGYDSNPSNFFSGPTNKGHVFTYAKDLLYALARERRDSVSTECWSLSTSILTYID
jgi:hypothetical protein